MKWLDVYKAQNKVAANIREGSNHRLAKVQIDGKTVITTRASRGRGEVPFKVTKKIPGQFHLNRAEFIDLFKCPMSKQEYHDLLRERLRL